MEYLVEYVRINEKKRIHSSPSSSCSFRCYEPSAAALWHLSVSGSCTAHLLRFCFWFLGVLPKKTSKAQRAETIFKVSISTGTVARQSRFFVRPSEPRPAADYLNSPRNKLIIAILQVFRSKFDANRHTLKRVPVSSDLVIRTRESEQGCCRFTIGDRDVGVIETRR